MNYIPCFVAMRSHLADRCCPTCIPDDVRDQVQALSEQARARMLAGEHDPGQPVGGLILSPHNYHEQA